MSAIYGRVVYKHDGIEFPSSLLFILPSQFSSHLSAPTVSHLVYLSLVSFATIESSCNDDCSSQKNFTAL